MNAYFSATTSRLPAVYRAIYQRASQHTHSAFMEQGDAARSPRGSRPWARGTPDTPPGVAAGRPRSARRSAAPRGRGGSRSWQPRSRPAVGVPYADSVLKAAHGVREPLDFGKLATTGKESRYSSIMPWQLDAFVEIIREELGDKGYKTFVDVSAHIGGEGIVIAKTLQLTGTMIEINPNTKKCLDHNVAAMGVADSLRTVEGDGAEYVMDMARRPDDAPPAEHIVYADPPWGGPEYVSHDKVTLMLGEYTVPQLVSAAIGSGVREFALKAPNNVDDSGFGSIDEVSCRKRVLHVNERDGPRPSFAMFFFTRVDPAD